MDQCLFYIWTDNNDLDVICETSICIVCMDMINTAPTTYISKFDLEVFEN